MRKSYPVVVGLAMSATFVHAQELPRSSGARHLMPSDSAAVLREAWWALTGEHSGRRDTWLWVPATLDTAGAFRVSPAVRDLLVQARIPASERRPVGDDTVVFRVTAWNADSLGELVEFQSSWTEVVGTGARRCRTGSMNVETVRVRQDGARQAERMGTVVHGDDICVPIPPDTFEAMRDDTLAVELIAIDDLVRHHAGGGRVIALDARFAAPGQAPPSMTAVLRPPTRQREIQSVIGPLSNASNTDTLHVRASAPIFGGVGARVSVTVSHRGIPGRRRGGFYETVEYRLRRESGRWVIYQRSQLGIT